jgi:glutamate 5-kinase
LLPKGIQAIHGHFTRDEVVRLVTEQSLEIARGVSRYASEALRGIQEQHSAEIQRSLGYTYGPVVIHRDDMIFCEPRSLC